MIGKLLKYQLRESGRIQLLVIGISFLVFFLGSFLEIFRFSNSFLVGAGMFISILSMSAAVLIGYLMLIITDYQNFYGKRAYFLQSVPAKTSELFISRFLFYLISLLCLYLIIGIQFWAFLRIQTTYFSTDEIDLLRALIKNMLPLIIGFGLFSVLFGVFVMMATVTLGSNPAFRKLGAGGPVIMYIIIYVIQQIGTLLTLFLIPLGVKITLTADQKWNFQLLTQNMIAYYGDLFTASGAESPAFIGIGFLFYYIIMGIVLAVLTYRSMKYKVNLR